MSVAVARSNWASPLLPAATRPPARVTREAADEARWRAQMVAAQAGDADAYRALLRELVPVLEGFLRRRLTPDAIDDCVQETLIAVHGARHTYDPQRPFRTWLFALARHKSIDQLRRQATRNRYGSDAETDAVPIPTGRGREAWIDVARSLDALEPRLRDAVMWTKLEGCTVAEAAERAGTTTAAMRSRVARGLAAMRRRFERPEENDTLR